MAENERVSARAVLTDPVNLLAFGFGSGLAPVAPGTFGSVVGVLFAFGALWLPSVAQWSIAVALVAAGFWICGESARRVGVHDHPGIVWDEIAALYPLLLMLPPTPAWWLAGFVTFRFFDIVKPWPIRDLDHRLHGGLGIMLDDLLAGLYAVILLIAGGRFLS